MRQSNALLTIDERGSKVARNSVLDCHSSPVGRQMTIENSVYNDFRSMFVDGINVFDWRLPGVINVKMPTIVDILTSISVINTNLKV